MDKYTKENIIKLFSSAIYKMNSFDEDWFNNPELKKICDYINGIITYGPLTEKEKKYFADIDAPDKKDIIKIYIPHHKILVSPVITNLHNLFYEIKNKEFVELVDKYKTQKTAMRAISTNSDLLLECLNSFLKFRSIDSKVMISEKDDTYEFIIQDLIVKNSQERLFFVNNFKNFLISIGYDNLADSIINELHNVDDFPDYEEWMSINVVANKIMSEPCDNLYARIMELDEIKEHCIGLTDTNTNQYFITINNYGDTINVYEENVINNYNTMEDFNNNENGFVEYIKKTKPDWYPAKGGWLDIHVLYEEYKKFGLTTQKRYFSKKLKDILWTQKKLGGGNYPTKYLCKKLWD